MNYKVYVLITVLCLALCSQVTAAVAAVDGSKKTPVVKESELKLRLKALAFEASKAGDIWTAIQAENFAREKLGVRSSGLISSIEIYGDPLFAFPHEIAAYFDRGERLIVAAGRRVYQIASAGYPLQLSIPLRLYPRYCGISKDGRYLAAIDRRYDPTVFDVSVVDLTDGKEVWATQVNRGEDTIVSGLRLSADGQAIGCVVRTESGSHRIQIFEANGRNTPLYGFDRVYAVGNGGRWGIGQKVEKIEETYKKSIVVVKGGDQHTVIASAAGDNGVAAVITQAPEFNFTIIGLDGTFTPVIAPSPFSASGELFSTGEWLVAETGAIKGRGKTGEVDLLGNEIIEKDRPNTAYCYRWADLVTPETAKPKHMFEGKPYVSYHNPGKVYIQSDGGLAMHDLDNELLPPVVIAQPKSFDRLSIDRGRLVMTSYKGGDARIASLTGETLWEGKARRIEMLDAWHAVVDDDKHQKVLVHLHADEAQRKEVVLDMKGLSYQNFDYDMYDRRLVGWNWESKSNWTAFDVQNGSRLEHHMGDKYRPEVPEWEEPYSEFKVQMARLVPRNEPRGDDPSRYWNPRDAWRVGSVLLVLDHHGQVYMSGRKRGTYTILGSVDNADRFGFIGGDQLALADKEDMAVATIPGPSIIPARPGSNQRVSGMPEGPWRVKDLFYVPPRTSSMLFNASKCGFKPRLFRSPPGGTNAGMLMVTDSVVIEVDAALGRYIGDVDKKGLREK